jgi:hypothetical protein
LTRLGHELFKMDLKKKVNGERLGQTPRCPPAVEKQAKPAHA